MKYFFILFLHYGKGCRRKTNTLVGKKIKDLGMGKFWLKKKKGEWREVTHLAIAILDIYIILS